MVIVVDVLDPKLEEFPEDWDPLPDKLFGRLLEGITVVEVWLLVTFWMTMVSLLDWTDDGLLSTMIFESVVWTGILLRLSMEMSWPDLFKVSCKSLLEISIGFLESAVDEVDGLSPKQFS